MANRTAKEAKNIHGTNPQYLIEKIIRSRIYDSKYWKEQCFALTAELLVDKAMELRFVGGVFGGNIKPTQFLCLTLKMLQIQPEKDIVVEFIKNEEFKYVRALGAFYLRLTGTSVDCYKYLEPLFNDNRKLRRQNRMGHFEIVYMDEFIDELLRNDRVCDIILPRIQKRSVLEENNELNPKVSALDEDLDEDIPSEDELTEAISKQDAITLKKKLKKKETSDSKELELRIEQKRLQRDYEKEKEFKREMEKDREKRKERELRERGKEREKELREKEREREKLREVRDKEWEREKEKRSKYDKYSDNEKKKDKERERDRRRH